MCLFPPGEYITIHVSRPHLMETIQLNSHLDTGSWQHISLEFATGQVRVAINKAEFVFELREERNDDSKAKEHKEEPLYVAGRPG